MQEPEEVKAMVSIFTLVLLVGSIAVMCFAIEQNHAALAGIMGVFFYGASAFGWACMRDWRG